LEVISISLVVNTLKESRLQHLRMISGSTVQHELLATTIKCLNYDLIQLHCQMYYRAMFSKFNIIKNGNQKELIKEIS